MFNARSVVKFLPGHTFLNPSVNISTFWRASTLPIKKIPHLTVGDFFHTCMDWMVLHFPQIPAKESSYNKESIPKTRCAFRKNSPNYNSTINSISLAGENRTCVLTTNGAIELCIYPKPFTANLMHLHIFWFHIDTQKFVPEFQQIMSYKFLLMPMRLHTEKDTVGKRIIVIYCNGDPIFAIQKKILCLFLWTRVNVFGLDALTVLWNVGSIL